MPLSISIGASLQRARKAAKLSQAQVAERTGVARMTIQRLEADSVDTKLSTVEDAARSVGLELMLVPASLVTELEDFIRAGGKLVGQAPGIEAPITAVQEIRQQVQQRLAKLRPILDDDAEEPAP